MHDSMFKTVPEIYKVCPMYTMVSRQIYAIVEGKFSLKRSLFLSYFPHRFSQNKFLLLLLLLLLLKFNRESIMVVVIILL